MPNDHKELALLVIQANHLKVIAEEAQRAFQSAQQEIVDLMQTYSVPRVSAFEDETGLRYTGTLVESDVSELDQDGLRKSLDQSMWERVTRRVVDPKKLEAHVITGDIDESVVAKHTVVKRRKPYIRFTVKQQGVASQM
jgi:hypothetical protein